MITTTIPVISSSAGEYNDGQIIGKINKSNPVAVLLGESLVTISQVMRKAVTGNNSNWQDFTTEATNSTAGDFAPFGTASEMSAGDAFYFRTLNDEDPNSIYVQIATAGVGTWTIGFQEWNTTTEAWEDVTGLVDASNGLKAVPGVYKVSYTGGPEGKLRLDDASPKYLWHRIVLKTFTSATTAPVLSRLWSANATIKYKNITASHTSSPADWTSLPAEILPRVGDCYLFIHPYKSIGEDVVITLPASANYTSTWRYYDSAGALKNLTVTSDETTAYTVAASTTERKVRFAVPTDWGARTFTDTASVQHTGYVTCLQITAVTTEAPVAPPKVQSKSRSYGNANTEGELIMANSGINHISMLLRGLITGTGSVDIVLQNLTEGKEDLVTIPVTAVQGQYVNDLSIADIKSSTTDWKLGARYAVGSRVYNDVEVKIHTTA